MPIIAPCPRKDGDRPEYTHIKSSSPLISLASDRDQVVILDKSNHKCVLCPVGDFFIIPESELRESIHRLFSLHLRTDQSEKDFSFAFDHNRQQYHSTPILDSLAHEYPSAEKVIGLVSVDLFIPILTHVFGEAQLDGTSCVVSTFRLDQDLPAASRSNILKGRIIKEILHELGHTYGLIHCKEPSCVMHYCRTIKDVDRKTDTLCRYCGIMLADKMKRMKRQN